MSLTVVIPAKDEAPEWVEQLVAIARFEADAVLVTTDGPTKAHAMNAALAAVATDKVAFVDADVRLHQGQLTTVASILDQAPFVAVPSDGFVPVLTGGWFFGARTDTFRSEGGWQIDPVEDWVTIMGLRRRGHKVAVAPFYVDLRRPPRSALLKIMSAAFYGRGGPRGPL